MEDVVKLKNALLGPSRNTLLVVGPADGQELVNALSEIFKDIPINVDLAPLPVPSPPRTTGLRIIEQREDCGATNIGMAWPLPPYGIETDALKAAAKIICGPRGSGSLVDPLIDANIIYQCDMLVPRARHRTW